MTITTNPPCPWTSEAPPAEASALRNLIESMSLGSARLTEVELDRVVVAVALRSELWADLVVDDPEERWWLVLFATANYDVRLMAWESEQDTKWHDHGGSSGAQAVCAGRLREDYRARDHVGVESRRLDLGSHGSFGPAHVHDVSHEAGHPAISIHAYSPPLTGLTYYVRTPFGFVATEILPDDRRSFRSAPFAERSAAALDSSQLPRAAKADLRWPVAQSAIL